MPHLGDYSASPSTGLPIQTISVSASPFTYTATSFGAVIVQGGTASLVELGRGGSFVNVGVTAGVIPVSPFDQIRVTYTVSPTMRFAKK